MYTKVTIRNFVPPLPRNLSVTSSPIVHTLAIGIQANHGFEIPAFVDIVKRAIELNA
jgi:hypothetical protein